MKRLKGIDGKLDNAWSKLVKLRAGNKCEYCGAKNTQIDSHHIFTRVNRSVRWDPKNGIALCAKHHTLDSKFSAHGTPYTFHKWLEDYKGEDFMQLLTIKAHQTVKHHSFEKELLLQELNKEIEKYLELTT